MKKKKLVRNIVIAAAAVLVLACVIVLSILLRDDARGLNYFERNKVVASAAGQSVKMGEYAMALDNSLSYYMQYGNATYTDEELKELKTNVLQQLLDQKVYVAKMNELGLNLTAEELDACKKAADDQVTALEESLGKQMSTSGNFSKASLESQINSYFTRQLGMSKSQYKKMIAEQTKASYAAEKLEAYYDEQIKGYTEDELLDYYNTYVTENFGDTYESGMYSMYMQMYEIGYSQMPYLFVPEGFVYVDVIELNDLTEEQIHAFYARYEGGESFEDLQNDPLNAKNAADAKVKGPYAIGDLDYGYAANDPALYKTASEMEIGEVKLLIAEATEAEGTESAAPAEGTEAAEGTEPVKKTAYLIRRTEGKLCKDGAQTGVVDIDAYEGVRDTIKASYENERFQNITSEWTADAVIDETAYAYTTSGLNG